MGDILNLKELFASRLSRRLLAGLILISSTFTLAITVLQLTFEFQDDIKNIENSFGIVEQSYLNSVAKSIWSFDEEQIRLQLSGISRLPGIVYASIETPTGPLRWHGTLPTDNTMFSDFKIEHIKTEAPIMLGTLKVAADLNSIYGHLIEEAFFFMISSGIKTFFVSLSMFYLMNRLVGRRLNYLSTAVKEAKPGEFWSPVDLQYKGKHDEIADLAATINKLGEAAYKSTQGLRNLNAELEDRIAARTTALSLEVVERKRAETEVKQLLRDNQIVLDSVGDGICGFNPDGLCSFVNPAGARILGLSVGEIISQPYQKIMQRTKPDGVPHSSDERLSWTGVENQRSNAFTNDVFWHKDGTSIPVEYRKTPMIDDGRPAGAVMVFRDVTERQALQAQIIQSSKMATLGEMATGLAHELNQPLNIIRMSATNIQRRAHADRLDPEFLNGRLTRIDAQIERAAAIIDHMRIFGRKPSLSPDKLDAREMVTGALNLIGEQLRLANIKVVKVEPDQALHVMGHQVQIEQIMLNLLGNARDVLANHDGEKRITITASAVGELVRISVEDTGGGIAPGDLPRVFEPFFTTKEIGKGTGLGLSISYGIVSDMGGTITAENGESGAVFTVTLPMTD